MYTTRVCFRTKFAAKLLTKYSMYLENFIQRDIIIKPFIINKTSNISYDREINAINCKR